MQARPAPRPVDFDALRRLSGELPFELAPVFDPAPRTAVFERADRGLSSQHAGRREDALRMLLDAADRAAALGLADVVLQPGELPVQGEFEAIDVGTQAVEDAHRERLRVVRRRQLDASLEQVCRSLHEACRERPETRFLLSAGRSSTSLLDPAALELIIEDLARHRIGYWHDAAVCAGREEQLEEAQGAWLEAARGRLRGVALGDQAGGEIHLPPGAGRVDFPLIEGYVARQSNETCLVLELDPSVPATEIRGAHSLLDKHRL